MPNSIDFREAEALQKMYTKPLIEDYNYTKSKNKSLFSVISSSFKIINVEKINNPQLYGMYLLWKQEFKNSNLYASGVFKTIKLYHATSPSRARQIARSNIDWRKTERSRFGIGACFSPCPLYANAYASSKGAFIIFNVLTKNIEDDVDVNYELEVPTSKDCDTTLSSNEKVYVKYYDYQFYPKFIVYYR